jgi:intracellular sulfur oxidation DsrE/DsrF family protein
MSALAEVPPRGRGYAVVEPWLEGLTGAHRAFFDVDAIREGILGRVDNFYSVYRDHYALTDSHVNVVFGAHGNGLGFALDDATWAKYRLGELYHVTDPKSAAPAARNIFVAMDPAANWPTDYSITKLQSRGMRVLACQGSMRNLARQLAGRDGARGNAEAIYAELNASLIPGVTAVPAMIVAQNLAQEAGLKYVYVI